MDHRDTSDHHNVSPSSNNITCLVSLTHYRCETILERSTWARHDDDETDSPTSAHGPTQFAKRITSYLYKIGQIWAPEYIPLCHPIICCAVVVPGSTDSEQSDSAIQAREVAKIVLTHYAKYWKLGSEMLRKYDQSVQTQLLLYSQLMPAAGLLSIIETGISSELDHAHSDERRLFLKQYSILLPTMSKRKSACPVHRSQPRGDEFNLDCFSPQMIKI